MNMPTMAKSLKTLRKLNFRGTIRRHFFGGRLHKQAPRLAASSSPAQSIHKCHYRHRSYLRSTLRVSQICLFVMPPAALRDTDLSGLQSQGRGLRNASESSAVVSRREAFSGSARRQPSPSGSRAGASTSPRTRTRAQPRKCSRRRSFRTGRPRRGLTDDRPSLLHGRRRGGLPGPRPRRGPRARELSADQSSQPMRSFRARAASIRAAKRSGGGSPAGGAATSCFLLGIEQDVPALGAEGRLVRSQPRSRPPAPSPALDRLPAFGAAGEEVDGGKVRRRTRRAPRARRTPQARGGGRRRAARRRCGRSGRRRGPSPAARRRRRRRRGASGTAAGTRWARRRRPAGRGR